MTELCINDIYLNNVQNQTMSTRVGAITANKIRAMRKEEVKAMPAHIMLANLFNDAMSAISQTLSFKALSTNSKMCENYGHVIDQKNWTGHLPRCADCNAIIDDPKSLRKSSCEKIDPDAERFVQDSFGRWTRA